jgi:signal transduction histidine kinase
MTRRIAIAILLTVWVILIAGGCAAYLATRAVLIAELDESLRVRAQSLPQVFDEHGRRYFAETARLRADDRYLVRDSLGRTVARHDPQRIPAGTEPPALMAGSFFRSGGELFRSITLRAHARGVGGGAITPVVVTFTGSAAEFDRLTARLAWTFTACVVLGGLVAALVARRVARLALRPLEQTASTIGAIDERTLDSRIDEAALPPELTKVAHTLNGLLARLDEAFAQRRRFLADAAHELRTPVAAMTTTLEVALRRPRDAPAYRDALATCLADARVLRGLVESLLTQARAELPATAEPKQSCDLGRLILECVSSMSALAAERDVKVRASLPMTDAARAGRNGSALVTRTEPGRLRSVLINLIGNAIEHNRPGGEVTVAIEEICEDASVRISVTDTGPGIDARHLPHLFEPFYRVDGGKRSNGHLGLGLFLVQTHVRELGGQCRVRSQVGCGTTFEIALPIRTEICKNDVSSDESDKPGEAAEALIDISRTEARSTV